MEYTIYLDLRQDRDLLLRSLYI